MNTSTATTISRSNSMESISSAMFDFLEKENDTSSVVQVDVETSFETSFEASIDMADFDFDDTASWQSKSSADVWLALVATPKAKKTSAPLSPSLINMSIIVSDSESDSDDEHSLNDDDFGLDTFDNDDDNCGLSVVSLEEPTKPLLVGVVDVVPIVRAAQPLKSFPVEALQKRQRLQNWSMLRVVDLKEELKRRGLKLSGIKAQLVARLEESDRERTAEAVVNYVSDSDDEEEVFDVADIFSEHAEDHIIGTCTSAACHALSDEDVASMMGGRVIDSPVKQRQQVVVQGDDAVARMLHYLRFYQNNQELFRAAHAIVHECYYTNNGKSQNVSGLIFERFVEIMGEGFLPIFQYSLRLSLAEVRSAAW